MSENQENEEGCFPIALAILAFVVLVALLFTKIGIQIAIAACIIGAIIKFIINLAKVTTTDSDIPKKILEEKSERQGNTIIHTTTYESSGDAAQNAAVEDYVTAKNHLKGCIGTIIGFLLVIGFFYMMSQILSK